MSLTTYHANRVEMLFEILAERMGQVPEGMGALETETVLLENPAMGSWLNLQLAQRHGVAANIEYQRLSAFFWRVARALVVPGLSDRTPLDKQELTWRLFGILGDGGFLGQDALAPVRRYLGDDGATGLTDLKQFQLAARVADLFDQYLVFRPGWIVDGWDRGAPAGKRRERRAGWADDEAWQRLLWQEVSKRAGEPATLHRARVHRLLCEHLSRPALPVENLPFRRLFVFGVTALPESDLQVLMGLARHVDVDLFLLNPSAGFWCDIPSRQQAIREEAAAYRAGPRSHPGPPEIGHPLLAAQADQVRDFLKLVYEQAAEQGEAAGLEDFDAFISPDRDRDTSLLASVQQDMLELRFRGETATLSLNQGKPPDVPAGELAGPPSIHFHSCHGLLREVEVLRDQLLDLFERDPTLKPRDVVVMMPRVAPYAPYIHAVFADAGGEGRPRIDYHIADRTLVEEAPLLEAFEALLELPDSRLPLSSVLGLLEVPAVLRRFRLDRDDFEAIRRWLVDAGVHWGEDGDHRRRELGTAYREASWDFGIDRLLAGYAMRSGDDFSVLGVQPMDEIEGGRAAALDGFLRFWRQLERYRNLLEQSRSPVRWAALLDDLLDAFFEPDAEDQAAMVEVRRGLQGLTDAAGAGWHTGDISLSVVRAAVRPVLRQSSGRRHPWSEGVKFCSLLPMRGVPFRVVYLLGMNMEDYPRRIERPGFDLMREDYRPGDRSARVDDRWLFLEALLSARQAFHVSYIGQDMHRNEPRQPSVVVSELQDCLREGYDTGAFDKDGEIQPGRLFTRHALQPFSRANFHGGDRAATRLFSLDANAYAVAERQAETRRDHAGPGGTNDVLPAERGDRRWLARPLSGEADRVAADGAVEVDIEDFIRFFSRPSQWLFRRLGVTLARYDERVEDDEMLGPGDGLARWQRIDELLARVERDVPVVPADPAMAGRALVDRFVHLGRQRGAWPLGEAGIEARAALDTLSPDYLFFRPQAGARRDLPVIVDIEPANAPRLRLRGQLQLHGDRFAHQSASRAGWKTLLDYYPRVALAACMAADAGSLAGAAAAFYDGKASVPRPGVRVDKEDWPVQFGPGALADGPAHRAFLSSLADLYWQYRQTGLPFEPKLGMGVSADDLVAYRETVMKRWLEGDFSLDNAMRRDLRERAYYGEPAALLAPAFIDVCERLTHAIDQWTRAVACPDD